MSASSRIEADERLNVQPQAARANSVGAEAARFIGTQVIASELSALYRNTLCAAGRHHTGMHTIHNGTSFSEMRRKDFLFWDAWDLDTAFAIPVTVTRPCLHEFNTTRKLDKSYWHVKIIQQQPNEYALPRDSSVSLHCSARPPWLLEQALRKNDNLRHRASGRDDVWHFKCLPSVPISCLCLAQ